LEGLPDRNANVPEIEKKKNDYFEQNLKKASYLAEKATFNDLTSKKISKKVVTPKNKQ